MLQEVQGATAEHLALHQLNLGNQSLYSPTTPSVVQSGLHRRLVTPHTGGKGADLRHRAQRAVKALLLQLLPQGQCVLDALLPAGTQILAVSGASAQRCMTRWPFGKPVCTHVLANSRPTKTDLGSNRGDRQPIGVQRHDGVVARQSACALGLTWTD